MTDILTKMIVNCETGEEEIIPLTTEEIALAETAQAEYEAEKARILAEEEAKIAAKASALAKLAALGLTEEEANALVK